MNYVSDTVPAFLGVGAADGVEGELFNVGSGVGRTVADMLAAIQRVTGVDKPVRAGPRRDSGREERGESARLRLPEGSEPPSAMNLEWSSRKGSRSSAITSSRWKQPADPTGYHV